MTSEEIKQAMQTFARVKCNDRIYQRIAAYTYRVIPSKHRNTYKAVFQCELLDLNGNSVTVVEAEKVELVEDESSFNEHSSRTQ